MYAMWIRIVKASSETYWYSKLIGKSFEVVGETSDQYQIRDLRIHEDGIPGTRVVHAPVLKEDVELLEGKSYPETRKVEDWRIRKNRFESVRRSAERSGFNTRQEIERYEELNREAEVKTIKIRDIELSE